MHGFVFNRNLAWRGKDKDDGELIVVDSEASLIVNGGTEAERNSHTYKNVAVYNNTVEMVSIRTSHKSVFVIK